MKITRFLFRKLFNVASDIHIYLQFGGTDVLLLYQDNVPGFTKFQIARYRWFMRRIKSLNHIYCLVNSKKLEPFLREFGFTRIKQQEHEWQKIKIDRKQHSGFNVLFYMPLKKYGRTKYINWIYGSEYLGLIKDEFDTIVLDGTQDMREVLPIVDCYVKINRCPHSDLNRIGKECLYNNIPAKAFDVWEDGFNFEEIRNWINEIRRVFKTSVATNTMDA